MQIRAIVALIYPRYRGKIDFNWGSNANAVFYGCRSGKDPDLNEERSNDGKLENSFAKDISSMPNMKNVSVWGQTERSWPSAYTNVRSYDNTGKTYMVGSRKAGITHPSGSLAAFTSIVLGQPTYAYPMATYRNGDFTGNPYQPGLKK